MPYLLSGCYLNYIMPLVDHSTQRTDVKAAFDYVDRAALWKGLKGASTPLLMHLLHDLHTGTTAKVRMPNGFSLPFHTSSCRCATGLHTGPALFCCAIDWLCDNVVVIKAWHSCRQFLVHRHWLCRRCSAIRSWSNRMTGGAAKLRDRR